MFLFLVCFFPSLLQIGISTETYVEKNKKKKKTNRCSLNVRPEYYVRDDRKSQRNIDSFIYIFMHFFMHQSSRCIVNWDYHNFSPNYFFSFLTNITYERSISSKSYFFFQYFQVSTIDQFARRNESEGSRKQAFVAYDENLQILLWINIYWEQFWTENRRNVSLDFHHDIPNSNFKITCPKLNLPRSRCQNYKKKYNKTLIFFRSSWIERNLQNRRIPVKFFNAIN